jgi:hypothetical protein
LGYTSVFSLLASPLQLSVYVAIAKDVLFGNYSASSCDQPTEMEFVPPSSIHKKVFYLEELPVDFGIVFVEDINVFLHFF